MDIDFIERLLAVVARSPIDELELTREGSRIRIGKSAGRSSAEPSPRPPAAPALSEAATQAAPPAAVSRIPIRSPLTGVFYRSAAEGEPPLVRVGDVVEEGQKLGVIEAMKTFNPVEADRAGWIVEIAFEAPGSVSVGDVLFVLEDAV